MSLAVAAGVERASGTGPDVRWVREPAGRTLPDGLRLLEYLVDACEEEG